MALLQLEFGNGSFALSRKKQANEWYMETMGAITFYVVFIANAKKTEGKLYPSYWRMGPELTRLAGVPISLGLAEDRLDANLQELVIRPRSY